MSATPKTGLPMAHPSCCCTVSGSIITSGTGSCRTCSIARFTGTMTGPMQAPDGTEIPPTGRSFDVDFITIAKWDNEQIVEENLMYDLVTFMKQIGLTQ